MNIRGFLKPNLKKVFGTGIFFAADLGFTYLNQLLNIPAVNTTISYILTFLRLPNYLYSLPLVPTLFSVPYSFETILVLYWYLLSSTIVSIFFKKESV